MSSIVNLLNQIKQEEIVLPAIQRDFVWPEEKGAAAAGLHHAGLSNRDGAPVGDVLKPSIPHVR